MAIFKQLILPVLFAFAFLPAFAQDTIPAPVITAAPEGTYTFKPAFAISWDGKGQKAAAYFKAKFPLDKILLQPEMPGADIYFISAAKSEMGSGLFRLEILSRQIFITSATDEGFIRAIGKLAEFLPEEAREGKRPLAGISVPCIETGGK